MTNWTNKSKPNSKKPGGYESLIVYQQALVISNLNHEFCERFLSEYRYRRTVEQMEQAERSGKQNIIEASLEKSLKMNIKLTGVARGSYGELLEDYRDFLRFRNLKLWDKNDPRVLEIRATYKTNWSNKSNSSLPKDPEAAANLLITLITVENYLLDQMLRSLEKKFIEEGGYSENLFKKRLAYRNKNKTNE